MSDLLQRILSEAPKNKKRQRIGRGEGSKGKTSGRGQKGAGSRAGSSQRIGFEGGQTEAYRRFPQRGFSNKPFETKYHVVNLSSLERFDEGATVDRAALKQAGLIPNERHGVKVLGHGELGKKLTVVAAAFSRSAHQAITGKGGEAQNEKGQPYEFRPAKNRRLSTKLDKRLATLGLPPQKAAEEAGGTVATDDDAPTSAPESGEPAAKVKKPRKPKPQAADASENTSGESGDVTKAPESGAE